MSQLPVSALVVNPAGLADLRFHFKSWNGSSNDVTVPSLKYFVFGLVYYSNELRPILREMKTYHWYSAEKKKKTGRKQGLPNVLEFLLGLENPDMNSVQNPQHPPFILGGYRISHNRLWQSPIYWIVCVCILYISIIAPCNRQPTRVLNTAHMLKTIEVVVASFPWCFYRCCNSTKIT